MPVQPLGEFLPDHADYANPGTIRVSNVLPVPSGYAPFPSFEPLTTGLDERPRGAIQARDAANNVLMFAGDEAKLYQNISNVWTDVSRPGGYSTGESERWEFVRWKNKVLATNFSNPPQQIEMGDAEFENLTDELRMRHIGVVRDFVVAGNTFDSVDGDVPNRVRWSAFNNEDDWAVSPSTLSDFQDLNAGGWVRAVVGGEFGVIVSERSVWRMTFVGAPVVFQFDETLPGVGTISPGSVVRDGDTVFLLSDRGFFAIVNGTQATAIGANKVDQFILADLDQSHLDRISSVADPLSKRVMWAYPGQGNAAGQPNRIVLYDRTLDRWSLIETPVSLIWRAAGTAFTLEGLDNVSMSIDALPASLDSNVWKGGASTLGAFGPGFRSGFFTGANLPAAIDTKEMEIHGGAMTQLNAFRSLVDGGSVTAQVGTRNRQTDQVTFSPTLNQRPSGRFVCRENARYHRFRLNITGEWSNAIGVQVEPREARKGQLRG